MRIVRSAASAVLVMLLLLAAPLIARSAELPQQPLTVTTSDGHAHRFTVEIADEDRERMKGLMFRRAMPADEGMLFDFMVEQPTSFWMRNTYIPLDMLFIKADGTIRSIAERTTPLSEKAIPSKGPVRYVLEINGGVSETLGIKPGDVVSGPAIEARP